MDPDSARAHIAGMELAAAIIGDDLGEPSLELQSRVAEAAVERGLQVRVRRVVDDDGFPRWQAGITTARGDLWEDVTTSWEDAFRALGVL